jgi:uncharacterized protein
VSVHVHLPSPSGHTGGAAPSHPRAPGERPRGPMRRFLETRGTVGGHRLEHVEAAMRADDGTLLAASYLTGPRPHAPAVLLAHGFAAHRRKPAYAYLADELSRYAHVLSLDLRGHGGSGGASTLGDREALDIEAGLRWLRAYGHRWVCVIGMSMGGTSALHAGALLDGRGPDAVVVVSAPARLHEVPRTEPMRKLRAVWESPVQRYGMRALVKVRVVAPSGWTSPPHPEEAAASLSVPLLVVHGVDDAYFPIEDARSIAANAGGPVVLWEEPAGFGHAEDGVTAGFVARLGRAVESAHRDGRFPAADGAQEEQR